MRTTFIKTLIKLARKNKNLFLLTGDLGFSVFEEFQKEFSDRFINCGVAEQNMIGTAAGLALSGKKVIVYSIIPFVTMRPFEQIRNDICLHNLDVKIVGVGAGFGYGALGSTHHALEDVAIMKALPNMTILSPADPIEAGLATKAMVQLKSPVYLRLGKNKENIHSKLFKFKIGKGKIIKRGKDLTVVSAGSILRNVVLAVKQVEKSFSISIEIISMPTVKPIDKRIITTSVKKTKALIVVEEHHILGGMGETISHILMKNRLNIAFELLGVSDKFIKEVGDENFLRDKNNLSVAKIGNTIKKIWKLKTNIK